MARRRSDITEIGPWSEIKLAIIKKYAAAYSRILSTRTAPRLRHVYIDAFAGSGVHSSKKTGNLVQGSPAIALGTTPPFSEYHFIDLHQRKISTLQRLYLSGTTGSVDPATVHFHVEDCNEALLKKVFPLVRYESYRRALCLLDPYGLDLDWEVIRTAGEMRSVELFLNFPIHDMNRNVLRKDQSKIKPGQPARLTRFWGDASWHDAAYSSSGDLFGWDEKQTNRALAQAYRERLRDVAGFAYVPEPIAMKNTRGATVYYLFFASQKPVAADIVGDIFSSYRDT